MPGAHRTNSREKPIRSYKKPPSAGPPSRPAHHARLYRPYARPNDRTPAFDVASPMNASDGVMTANLEPHEQHDVDRGHNGDADEWQPKAAKFVQPAAERRSAHYREARAHHHHARAAAPLAGVIETRDEGKSDHPRHRVCPA